MRAELELLLDVRLWPPASEHTLSITHCPSHAVHHQQRRCVLLQVTRAELELLRDLRSSLSKLTNRVGKLKSVGAAFCLPAFESCVVMLMRHADECSLPELRHRPAN